MRTEEIELEAPTAEETNQLANEMLLAIAILANAFDGFDMSALPDRITFQRFPLTRYAVGNGIH